MTIHYREATKKEINTIAKLAAQSFCNYPFFRFAFRDSFKSERAYLAYMEKLHRIHIKANMRNHICLVGTIDETIVSTAMLQDPNKKRIRIGEYILSGGISLMFPVGFSRILDFFTISEEAHADCAKNCPGAWYLELLAVDGNRKGQGLGSNMLQDCVIPYIKTRGDKLLSLITNTEQNRKFYTKNGFQEFAGRKLTRQGRTIGNWSFLRAIPQTT